MKRKLILLMLTAALMTAGITGCGNVKQTQESVTVEAGQELSLNAAEFLDISEEKAGEVELDTSKVDTAKVGEYEATATYNKKTYTIKVKVEDTTAPSVELKQRYGFANDITAYDPQQLVEGIYDASEYTVSLKRFEKNGNLTVMDDAALKKLTDTIPLPGDQEKLAALGTEEIPTEEGIYRAVLEAKDSYGNVQLEEVYIILDKTGALIQDTPDKTVEQEDVTAEPEVNPADYVITDNVDGTIPADKIKTELSLTDEANHQYTVHVSYTDRAGNESAADFLINVTEKTEESETDEKQEKEKADSETGKNKGTSDKGSSGTSSETGGNKETSNSGNESSDSSGGADTSSGSGSGGGETADSGNSEPAPEPEPEPQPSKPDVQMYTVIPYNGGYSIFVNGGDEATGDQMLIDYLASMGSSCTHISGGWYDADNNIYNCYVSGGDIYSLE